ncbi:hypothetical protein Ahy_A03g013982 [Arachis hypogaea]|uniref:Cytochrome P450 71A1 n=1 Tax=Arachis hypogaea TaxID=3818 RepID=A0A445DWM7_ARAHY|nr:hypothetical protein Ahy_A03g013982 [Arachis hypogaea]
MSPSGIRAREGERRCEPGRELAVVLRHCSRCYRPLRLPPHLAASPLHRPVSASCFGLCFLLLLASASVFLFGGNKEDGGGGGGKGTGGGGKGDGGCIFGLKFETSDDGRKSIAEVVRKIQFSKLGVGDLFSSLDWVDVLTGFMSRIKIIYAELDAFLEEVIEEHKRKKKNCDDNNKDFVDVLLQLQERDMPEFELTKDIMKALLLDLFLAGSDTVSTTIEWAFAELANNPEIMKKVQEEVRRIVGGKSMIEENDLNEMKYMKCVIKETLRLHPPGPLLIPRETANSVEIKGYHIPKKVTVYINSYAIHRDPKLWDNAEEFIPERFEDSQQVDYKGIDFQFIPFGIGRRACPGMSFGAASLEYMMANLLYWFDWKVIPNNGAMIDMSELNGLTVIKKQPLYLEPMPYSIC